MNAVALIIVRGDLIEGYVRRDAVMGHHISHTVFHAVSIVSGIGLRVIQPAPVIAIKTALIFCGQAPLPAIVGDTVGYNIGARTGPRLFSRPDSLLFNRKHLITTKEFYERHGPFTIVIARFIPILRTFAPVVAGIGAMQYRRFISYNVIGGIGWVLTTVMGGYFLGQVIPNIHDHIHKVIVIVIILSLLPAIIKVAREKLRATSDS